MASKKVKDLKKEIKARKQKIEKQETKLKKAKKRSRKPLDARPSLTKKPAGSSGGLFADRRRLPPRRQ
ncbi:MAG: hypothetical protein CMH89_05305 [Oceanicaulis sp.]|nr:hypothetical protein [Oceanicaulis sp.]